MKRQYMFCDDHEDCYYIDLTDDESINNYNWTISCCTKNCCTLRPIGYRIYDENMQMISENIPTDRWFTDHSFDVKYLEKIDKVDLMKLENMIKDEITIE